MMIALENNARAVMRTIARDLSIYAPRGIHMPWQCPQWTLRNRATYGGRKGRAAVKRLKRMGARPIATPTKDEAE